MIYKCIHSFRLTSSGHYLCRLCGVVTNIPARRDEFREAIRKAVGIPEEKLDKLVFDEFKEKIVIKL